MNNRLKKLFSLSLEEIVFRIKEKVQIKLEHFFYMMGIEPAFQEVFQVKPTSFFFPSFYNYQLRKQKMTDNLDIDKIILEAESVVADQVTLLGQEMEIPSGDQWHIDPIEKIEWPGVFFDNALNHHSVEQCDVKFSWEINRHQYIIPLAKAFWLTRDERYSKKAFTIIIDWIDNNQYNKGLNWTSSLEHAVRLFAWVWSISLCNESDYYAKNISKIKQSIYQQAYYISKHLSVYFSPYNHLVGEAAALHLIGLLFPEFKLSGVWEKTGLKILEETVENQFHEDGVSVEQAFFYHHFTLGFYLQTIYLRTINGKSVSNRMRNRIQTAIESSVFLTMPNGEIPMVGDIDSARSLYFSMNHSWDFTGFHQLGAVLFGCGEFKPPNAEEMSEELLWIASDSDLAEYDKLDYSQPETVKVLENSGYVVMRDSWNSDSHYLCFDCGELADGLSRDAISSSAHGHLDGLSINISAFGIPFLVDGGLYTYFGDENWHRTLRQESCHNTLKLEGFSQAEYGGRFKWKNALEPEFINLNHDEKEAISFQGRILYNTHTSHYRKIRYQRKQFWIVHDKVNSSVKKLECENNFNFSPGIIVRVNNQKNLVLAEKGGVKLLIIPVGKGDFELFMGGPDPADGWICPGYGLKEKAHKAVFKWKLEDEESKGDRYFIFVPVNQYQDISLFKYNDDQNLLIYEKKQFHIDFNTLDVKQIVKRKEIY